MTRRDKYTAAFLSMIFGWSGMHQVYLRKPGRAFIFIAVFIFVSGWLAAGLGFLNALALLMMSQEEFDRRYNQGKPTQTPTWRRNRDYRRRDRSYNPSRRRPSSETRTYRERTRNVKVSERKKPNPFKTTGIKKYKDFDLDGAIKDFKQALEIDPSDIATHFNLACAYSLSEKADLAMDHISKAVALGFNKWDKIKTHDDLAFMRIQPEFEAFEKNGFRKMVQESPILQEEKKTPEKEKPEVLDDDILLSQLQKLAELREKGLITEEEFVHEKRKLKS